MTYEPTSITQYLDQAGIKPDSKHPILITSFISLQHIHFAAELEMVEELIRADFSVVIIRCSSGLKRCFANPEGLASRCRACKSTNKNMYSHVKASHLDFIDVEEILEPKDQFGEYENLLIDSLKNGAYASTIAFTKDPIISRLDHIKMYEENYRNSLQLFVGITAVIQKREISGVITFNGRFNESRVALEAAKANKIPAFCHESSGTGSTYRIFRGGQTHSLSFHKNQIQNIVENAELSDGDSQKARAFFEKQRSGVAQGSINRRTFVTKEFRNLLPDNFDVAEKNLSIFVSSEDEYSGFSEWSWPFGATQFDVLRQIMPRLLYLGFTVWIRLHPHLKGRLDNSQIIQMSSLSQDGVHVIAPDAPVDSYALISNSSNVISFGSTIGLEATYMGVNTILLGHSIYENLEINRVPKKLEDLESLFDLGVSRESKDLCLLVAHYLLMEFNEFQECNIEKSTKFLYFKNRKIAPTFLSRLSYKFASRFLE